MGRIKLLSTKILEPGLITEASEKGVEIHCIPFIQITSLVDARLEEKLRSIKDPFIPLVFTSENAVTAVAPYLDKSLANPLFCISGRTVQAAQHHFPKSNVIATADEGETLARKIIAHGAGKVIFFCGNKRRDAIPAALTESRISFEELVVYQNTATPTRIKDLFEAIAFFSPTAVESFFSCNELNAATVCFAIGQTTAASLEDFTSNPIIASPEPTQAALLQCVYNHFQVKTNSPP